MKKGVGETGHPLQNLEGDHIRFVLEELLEAEDISGSVVYTATGRLVSSYEWLCGDIWSLCFSRLF